MLLPSDLIVVYWKQECKWCDKAKALLSKHGLPYSTLELGVDISVEYFKMINPQIKTAPAIFINGKYIGGYTDLEAMIGNPERS